MTFELKHIQDISVKDFENDGCWAQYYSADDIEHLIKEGYSKTEVVERLEEVKWSDAYWFKTSFSSKETPYMFTKYGASFVVPSGKVILGYVEYTEYNGIQSYSLYVNNEFIGLNVHYPEITDVEEIKRQLGIKELYPLQITSVKGGLIDEVYHPQKQK